MDYARSHLCDMAYFHVIRSWLFAFAIASKIPSLASRDLELHSIAAILHDLGWQGKTAPISKDKRFEVDGANAAREFIEKEGKAGEWNRHRKQLLWDAIALHSTPSIAWEKEPEVVACSYGISADISNPDVSYEKILTWEEWKSVVQQYPRLGLKEGIKDMMCWLCETKPQTTYDNFVGQYGERFVEGYNLQGKSIVDFMEGNSVD